MWAGAGKTLLWMIALAFFLRLVIGIGLNKGLPVHGYGEEAQYHGYVFRDAHERDIAAWNLSRSEEPIWASFRDEVKADQYGGLLSLSAAIYRYLSPDAHRPFLILILGAFMNALAVPFFYVGLSKRWDWKLANLATWILALYPDGVLFGSSQMREPFMIGFSVIAFWAVLTWEERRKARMLAFAGCALGLLLISSRIALAILGFLLVWFLIEKALPKYKGPKWVLWVAAFTIGLIVLVASMGWFLTSSRLDMKLTEIYSGWVQKIIEEAGEQFRIPIIVSYGLAQPVLPAAIAEPSLWIWKLIMIPRAAGWYLLAPFLLYGMFTVFKAKPEAERRIHLWTAGFILVWLIVSSARAGGDLWDNPRYRANFLPWLSFLAAWAILWAFEHRDWWLARWLVVEAIFLGFFTNWYFSRYFKFWGRMPFWQNVAWIMGLSALVIGSGLVWDFRNRARGRKSEPSEP